jgi:hypothetical protein
MVSEFVQHEYLLSYGSLGDFGRFRPAAALTCRRGDQAVVRSPRGLELATVLCEATPGHAHFLPNTTVGPLLRLAQLEDLETAERMRERSQRLFEEGRALAETLNLSLELIDVEVLLDGEHAVVQHLRWEDCDPRPFVSTLSRRHDLLITLHDLGQPTAEPETEQGCGRPGCGRTAGGGCSTCGSGGGCSSCGSGGKEDLKEYFAGLRRQMHAEQRRPLL